MLPQGISGGYHTTFSDILASLVLRLNAVTCVFFRISTQTVHFVVCSQVNQFLFNCLCNLFE